MAEVRLILALHIHQPVGNFDGVFESAYRDSYEPFLEVAAEYPEVPFVLHISGPLLEWLAAKRPEYVERVKRWVAAGRVEILGGPYYEPILPHIPHRDRVGQMRAYARRLEMEFGTRPRGIWLPERVWEQSLVGSLVESGVEYTVLDDFHFERAGLVAEQLRGFYLTEDEGRLLKLFPNSERLRYLTPWQEPHESYEYLRQVARESPGAVLVCADDGEKFGGWPQTHDHVFVRGWLRRFFDMLRGNREWLKCTTFAEAVERTLPRGKVYVPDGSYREMTEWAMAPERYEELRAARAELEERWPPEVVRRLLAGGGSWRQFRMKYRESDEMSSRMLAVSRRLAELERRGADRGALERARESLYRGQCNCPYWHGAFGGLYLPHLRNAIYGNLIEADRALDEAEGKTGSWVEALVEDYNVDARNEVRLGNEALTAWVEPACGGRLYELDVRQARVNLLATLDRRPEAYHRTIREAALGASTGDGPPSALPEVLFKRPELERLLVYDRYPRKAFVDHFMAWDARWEDAVACRDLERGDFVLGAYLGRVEREPGAVVLDLERGGMAEGWRVHVRKRYRLVAGQPVLEVSYRLSELPPEARLRFGVELNVASLAGAAEDRYYEGLGGERLGSLSAGLDLHETGGIRLVDEWLPLTVELTWTRPGGVWCFPVETVSQSEGGFEGVYQSSVIWPHWAVAADAEGGWGVTIRWEARTGVGARAGRAGAVAGEVAAVGGG
ncbi:MAG: alpha-amylase [Isosphaeraceae bacterium]|jgi:alpha-amylase|nr:MAG: alpha-amylase [Isosphaeraceae bacterium]